MKILVFDIFEKRSNFEALNPQNCNFFQKNLMVAYVNIQYSPYKNRRGGGESIPTRSYGTEKSAVLRGLKAEFNDYVFFIDGFPQRL